MVALTERFEMRFDEETIRRIDAWQARSGTGSRAEAIRSLVEIGLERDSTEVVHFSDGEKVLLLMMKELYEHVGLENPEIDPRFIADVIYGGHFWAPRWKWSGVFHTHRDDPKNLSFVVDVLDMWTFVEHGYEQLSKSDRKKLEETAEPFGKNVKFRGFDGNNEAELIGIADFFIDRLGRFSNFKGRDLASHVPTVPAYRRMLSVFEGVRHKLVGRGLGLAELTDILKARRHPE
jgi:uncharacterized protein YfbU (UPF0304 family)